MITMMIVIIIIIIIAIFDERGKSRARSVFVAIVFSACGNVRGCCGNVRNFTGDVSARLRTVSAIFPFRVCT